MKIRNAADVYQTMQFLELEDRENVYLLHLNAKKDLIEKELISRGTLTNSLIHPREVFRKAIRNSAYAVILVHNHPSGDPSPSKKDIEITKRLIEVGELVGIPLLAHIIIALNVYSQVDPYLQTTEPIKETCTSSIAPSSSKADVLKAIMPLFRGSLRARLTGFRGL
ncbi:MAG: JAB domain-containing protein [Nitrospirota bacterium]